MQCERLVRCLPSHSQVYKRKVSALQRAARSQLAMESYATVGTIEASRDGAPLHLAVFDPTEELLWTASQAGMVYSHLLPTAEPYSAFRADEQMPVVALFPHPFGVITLNHDRVRFFSKGGMKLQEAVDRSPHRPKQPDMHPNPSPNRLAHPPESSTPRPPPPAPHPPPPLPFVPSPNPTDRQPAVRCVRRRALSADQQQGRAAPRVCDGAARRPPRAWALGHARQHVHTALARSSGRTALARSSPCGRPPAPGPRPHAQGGPLGPRGAPSPPGCRRGSAAAPWCPPKVAELAAFGRPGTLPSWPRSSRWRRRRRWCVSRPRSICSASRAAAAC